MLIRALDSAVWTVAGVDQVYDISGKQTWRSAIDGGKTGAKDEASVLNLGIGDLDQDVKPGKPRCLALSRESRSFV